MQITEPPFIATWRAQLALEYERRNQRTVLAARRHDGPLVVQKALYPEGDAVCHNIIVHPPAGILGGDSLEIDARVGAQAHTLLTTPGASKWYQSAGAWAQQKNVFVVAQGACLEWLPQETIVYDGALARLQTEVRLDAGARYIGWEVLCLGRGTGERFEHGQCQSSVTVLRDDKPLWLERGAIEAGGLLMTSPAGLNGKTVCGTLIAVAAFLAAMQGSSLAMMLCGCFFLGFGVGVHHVHLSSRTMEGALKGEETITASSMSMIRSLGQAIGTAIAGMVANMAGLGAGLDAATVSQAVTAVFTWAILPVAFAFWLIVRLSATAARSA